ncbi:MAG: hypothetical protein ACLFMS_08180, partial [Halorhodospira sp.]
MTLIDSAPTEPGSVWEGDYRVAGVVHRRTFRDLHALRLEDCSRSGGGVTVAKSSTQRQREY